MKSSTAAVSRLRLRRLTSGLCQLCGRRPCLPELKSCGACSLRNQEKTKADWVKTKSQESETAKSARRAQSREATRKLREARLANNKCVLCGDYPPRPGFTQCEACAQLRRDRAREYEAKRRANGECRRCRNPIRPGTQQCEAHLALDAERQQNRMPTLRSQQRAAGICIYCGTQPAREGRVGCAICATKNKVSYDKRGRRWALNVLSRSRWSATQHGGKPLLVTPEWLVESRLQANDTCEGCLKVTEKLRPDHSHLDGTFRAWLCGTCNSALGMVKDNDKTLERLAQIVKRHAAGTSEEA